jgi:hypothetical protein
MYLAAAVQDNGAGRVASTELSEKKAAAARASLDEAGPGAGSRPGAALIGSAYDEVEASCTVASLMWTLTGPRPISRSGRSARPRGWSPPR